MATVPTSTIASAARLALRAFFSFYALSPSISHSTAYYSTISRCLVLVIYWCTNCAQISECFFFKFSILFSFVFLCISKYVCACVCVYIKPKLKPFVYPSVPKLREKRVKNRLDLCALVWELGCCWMLLLLLLLLLFG